MSTSKRFRIQFLATHTELLSWADEWIRRWRLVAFAAVSWPTPSITSWHGSNLKLVETRAEAAAPSRLYFFPSGTSVIGRDLVQALEDRLETTDWAALDLGQSAHESLRESALSGYSSNPEADRVWRSLVRDVKRYTLGGGWAVSGLGVRVEVPSLRYTKEVAESHRAGLALKAFAGEVTYSLSA